MGSGFPYCGYWVFWPRIYADLYGSFLGSIFGWFI